MNPQHGVSHVDTKSAARRLSISPSYLEKLRANGKGPDYARIGRRVLYRTEDLDAWVEANTRRKVR